MSDQPFRLTGEPLTQWKFLRVANEPKPRLPRRKHKTAMWQDVMDWFDLDRCYLRAGTARMLDTYETVQQPERDST